MQARQTIMYPQLFLLLVVFHIGKVTAHNSSSQSLGECVTKDEVQAVVKSEIRSLVNQFTELQQNNTALLLQAIHPGSLQNPAQSCKNIPYGSPSGFYWIQSHPDSATQQYCDMTRASCCNRSRGGWMRVVNLRMGYGNQQCPEGFRLINSPQRSCGRRGAAGCVSTTFQVHRANYSRVCGRVIGYQKNSPDAFAYEYGLYGRPRPTSLDDNYIDGISLTYGRSPRKHIWSFAAARDEVSNTKFACPCTRPQDTYQGRIPSFVGEDYFCETGSRNRRQNRFYDTDPLWNGQGCGRRSTCCNFNNPPWFCKQLPEPTTEDIELRLCGDENIANEDTPIRIVEIYVQ